MNNIVECKLHKPQSNAIRLHTLDGFMGYWGIYVEGGIGRYMAYYGNPSDCFLIRLTNGKQYLLGCQNPADMVAYINSCIKK